MRFYIFSLYVLSFCSKLDFNSPIYDDWLYPFSSMLFSNWLQSFCDCSYFWATSSAFSDSFLILSSRSTLVSLSYFLNPSMISVLSSFYFYSLSFSTFMVVRDYSNELFFNFKLSISLLMLPEHLLTKSFILPVILFKAWIFWAIFSEFCSSLLTLTLPPRSDSFKRSRF